MKTLFHRVGVRLAVLVLMAAGPAAQTAAEDLNQIFQMGRAAFYKGDMETAYRMLSIVEASKPSHFETKAMLAQIRARKKTGVDTVKTSYEKVILPKVDFADVTLAEAVEGLRVLSKSATEGKVVPNVIIKDPALASKPLTLTLSHVPLTDAIRYMADLAGASAVYDRHAVILSPASSAAASSN